jgi:RND family efflux transporter MFP subunit
MTAHPVRLARHSLLAAVCLAVAACSGGSAPNAMQDPTLYRVARGDLPIVVRENAELQALRETIVRSEVESQSTIIWIVPEGTLVKQGDKLVELDVSELMEKADNQEITVGKAKNALDQAVIQQGILEKELITKRNTAASNLRIAQMELDKLFGTPSGKGGEGKNRDMVQRLADLVAEPKAPAPAAAPADAATPGDGSAAAANGPAMVSVVQVDPRAYAGLVDRVRSLLDRQDGSDPLERDMGEMANKILQATDAIRLAMADLKVKEDTLAHSRRLAGKSFITRNELDRDELAFQSQTSKVTIAWNDLELLINYTLETDRIKLRQDLDNARLELERVDASNEAERQKSSTDVDAKRKEYDVAKARFDNLKRQIVNGVIHAPTPGTVVYARIDRNRGGGDAVREGVQVRDRQELIILPDTTKMRCVIKVQEAQVDKVMRGQPAHVVVEAFQGETFSGRVTSVAPVADSNSGWMTSDRKVYTTIVELEDENPDGRLRSRMAANVTIHVDNIKDTLPVPLQAVFRDRSANYVWKDVGGVPTATPVRVGRQNTERVELLAGVAEGDVLHLRPPAGVAAPRLEQPIAPEPAPLKEPARASDGSGHGGGGPAGNAVGANGPGTNGAGTNGAGPGNGAPDGRSQRGPGMGAMRKKLTEMTPEELEQTKSNLGMYDRMISSGRERGEIEAANQAETALAAMRAALDKNDLATAQTHRDTLSKLGARLRPPRNPGGEGGDRPRRGGGEGGEGGGGGGGGGRRGGG